MVYKNKEGVEVKKLYAAVAELADALASGASGRKPLRVQISPAAHAKISRKS